MGKAGRPKADVTKEKVVSVRMKPEDYEKLKAYADSSEMTVTEVVQKGVSIILDEEKTLMDSLLENERRNTHGITKRQEGQSASER